MFPELVTGREDDFEHGPWTILRGSTLRGEASCDLKERVLQVPLGEDPTSRVVRAHELVHARVSPHNVDWGALVGDVPPRALECAEEFRVNTILQRLHFDVALLRDGSEKIGGRRLAEAGEWGQAVCFLLAVLGTGAERDYLAGVRAGDPTWLPGLRAIRKRALHLVEGRAPSTLGATNYDDQGVPKGYAQTTVVLARLVAQAMESRVPIGVDALRQFRRSLEPGGRRAPTGRFAPLVFAPAAPMRCRPRTPGIRHRSSAPWGIVLRYPGRLLTDPQQRAFAGRTHRHGGVVVIDQSGSMDIDEGALNDLLGRAPDALVVGYSHRPGDTGQTPNAWLLAERGRVAVTSNIGNVGNGVDGPVLRWAIAQRRSREPIVWVTDGQVTDSHDHPDDALSTECAELVRRYSIRMARDLSDATRELSGGLAIGGAGTARFGRVGRKLLEI